MARRGGSGQCCSRVGLLQGSCVPRSMGHRDGEVSDSPTTSRGPDSQWRDRAGFPPASSRRHEWPAYGRVIGHVNVTTASCAAVGRAVPNLSRPSGRAGRGRINRSVEGGVHRPAPRRSPPVDPRTRPAAGVWTPAADRRRTEAERGAGMKVIEVAHLHKRYGDDGRGRRRVVHRRGGRDLRHPRPQRRREDHHRRVRVGSAPPRRGEVSGARPRPPPRPRRAAPGARRPAPGERAARQAHGRARRSTCSPPSTAPRRHRRLLERLGPGREGGARYKKLSGGQKQRLSIALAHGRQPAAVVLDELTTGLDPHARRTPGTWSSRSAPRASRSCWSRTSWRRPSGCATGSR